MVEMADKATPENWNVVKLRIWARQWRAAKLAPKKCGDKVQTEHSGPDGGPMEVAAVTYTDADRARALADFMAKTRGSFVISPPPQASDGKQFDVGAHGKKLR